MEQTLVIEIDGKSLAAELGKRADYLRGRIKQTNSELESLRKLFNRAGGAMDYTKVALAGESARAYAHMPDPIHGLEDRLGNYNERLAKANFYIAYIRPEQKYRLRQEDVQTFGLHQSYRESVNGAAAELPAEV